MCIRIIQLCIALLNCTHNKMSATDIPTQMLTTCRMEFNSDSWTDTDTGHSSHLQEIDNPKHQMHLLWQPQSMNSCTCAQAGQQHQCDLCLLLASQVSYLAAGKTAKDKTKSGSGGKCKHPHLISTQNVQKL